MQQNSSNNDPLIMDKIMMIIKDLPNSDELCQIIYTTAVGQECDEKIIPFILNETEYFVDIINNIKFENDLNGVLRYIKTHHFPFCDMINRDRNNIFIIAMESISTGWNKNMNSVAVKNILVGIFILHWSIMNLDPIVELGKILLNPNIQFDITNIHIKSGKEMSLVKIYDSIHGSYAAANKFIFEIESPCEEILEYIKESEINIFDMQINIVCKNLTIDNIVMLSNIIAKFMHTINDINSNKQTESNCRNILKNINNITSTFNFLGIGSGLDNDDIDNIIAYLGFIKISSEIYESSWKSDLEQLLKIISPTNIILAYQLINIALRNCTANVNHDNALEVFLDNNINVIGIVNLYIDTKSQIKAIAVTNSLIENGIDAETIIKLFGFSTKSWESCVDNKYSKISTGNKKISVGPNEINKFVEFLESKYDPDIFLCFHNPNAFYLADLIEGLIEDDEYMDISMFNDALVDVIMVEPTMLIDIVNEFKILYYIGENDDKYVNLETKISINKLIKIMIAISDNWNKNNQKFINSTIRMLIKLCIRTETKNRTLAISEYAQIYSDIIKKIVDTGINFDIRNYTISVNTDYDMQLVDYLACKFGIDALSKISYNMFSPCKKLIDFLSDNSFLVTDRKYKIFEKVDNSGSLTTLTRNDIENIYNTFGTNEIINKIFPRTFWVARIPKFKEHFIKILIESVNGDQTIMNTIMFKILDKIIARSYYPDIENDSQILVDIINSLFSNGMNPKIVDEYILERYLNIYDHDKFFLENGLDPNKLVTLCVLRRWRNGLNF